MKYISYIIVIHWKNKITQDIFCTNVLEDQLLIGLKYFVQLPHTEYNGFLSFIKIAKFPTKLIARLIKQEMKNYSWCELDHVRYDILKKSIEKI